MEKWVISKVEEASLNLAQRMNYSNADKPLKQLDGILTLFDTTDRKENKNLRPSLEDPTLLTQKNERVEEM